MLRIYFFVTLPANFLSNFIDPGHKNIFLVPKNNSQPLLRTLIQNYSLFLLTQKATRSLIALPCGQIAQSVEQRTENPCVAGSIPALATI